jgi:hypothetical protein
MGEGRTGVGEWGGGFEENIEEFRIAFMLVITQ